MIWVENVSQTKQDDTGRDVAIRDEGDEIMDDEKRLDPCDIPDEDGIYHCPYEDTYTGYESEMCRVCCGLGVDE